MPFSQTNSKSTCDHFLCLGLFLILPIFNPILPIISGFHIIAIFSNKLQVIVVKREQNICDVYLTPFVLFQSIIHRKQS
jgi:hypothetical protein